MNIEVERVLGWWGASRKNAGYQHCDVEHALNQGSEVQVASLVRCLQAICCTLYVPGMEYPRSTFPKVT